MSGLWFWSSDPNRDTCGDTEEDEYTFIGAPIIDGFSQEGENSRMLCVKSSLVSSRQENTLELNLILFSQGGEMIFT